MPLVVIYTIYACFCLFLCCFFPPSVVKYVARLQYPLVHIQGEETTTFTNGLGESIDLEINDNQDSTIERLVKILDGNRVAAELLAAEVHRTVICEHGDIDALPDLVWMARLSNQLLSERISKLIFHFSQSCCNTAGQFGPVGRWTLG